MNSIVADNEMNDIDEQDVVDRKAGEREDDGMQNLNYFIAHYVLVAEYALSFLFIIFISFRLGSRSKLKHVWKVYFLMLLIIGCAGELAIEIFYYSFFFAFSFLSLSSSNLLIRTLKKCVNCSSCGVFHTSAADTERIHLDCQQGTNDKFGSSSFSCC